MAAKRLARTSGLDYAILSGGDVAPLGGGAVTQVGPLINNGVEFEEDWDSFLERVSDLQVGQPVYAAQP